MSNIVTLESSPKFKIQSVAEIIFEVFDNLQANEAKMLECRNIESSQAHRRYKSMLNLVVRTNSAGDVPDIELPFVPSMELQVSTASLSTKSSATTPATAEVSEVGAPSNISSSLPNVQPVKAGVLQSSSMYKMVPLQFDGAASKNGSTKSLAHQADSIQKIVTHGDRSDAGTNPTVTEVIPRRRSLWIRTKKFVRQMFCCCVIGIDRSVQCIYVFVPSLLTFCLRLVGRRVRRKIRPSLFTSVIVRVRSKFTPTFECFP